MRVRVGAQTDTGRLRERNEDAYLIREPLFAVADGMGGHRGGDVASALALEVLQGGNDSGPDGTAERFASLVEEIKQANRRVLERGESDAQLRGMGTTLTAVLAEPERAHVAHVGDSRAYLFRDGALQQLTEDHTLVQRMVREGRLRPEEAESHPQRSIVTRALGVDDDLEVDQLSLDLHSGDRLLLCTDGLTTMLSKDQIQEILESEADPQRASDRLVEAANQAGGGDNITVIVLAIEEDSGDGGEPSSGDRTAFGTPHERDGPSMGEDPTGAEVGDGDATRLWEPNAKGTAASSGPGQASGPASPPAGRKRRWRRVAVWIGGILLVLVALVVGLRAYVDRQWYVGDERGCVAIFNGIPTTILGYELSHPEQGTNVATEDATRLAPWRNLTEGITANSFEDARAIVEQIRQDVSAQPPTATSTRCASSGAAAGGSP